MKAKIFYFTLRDQQTKEEKLDWFDRTRFEQIPFDHIAPDQKANWINLTDNDFDSFLPLIDKEVKAGKSQEAVFQLFSSGVKTQRDEWVYDFSKEALSERMKYFVEVYQERLEKGVRRELDIKWDRELEKYLERRISKKFEQSIVVQSSYRPFIKLYFYFDKHFNGMTYQLPSIFPDIYKNNLIICCTDAGSQKPFMTIASNAVSDLHAVGAASSAQCLPLYRYDQNGNRIDNITDWGLTQFQTHYKKNNITKENIFHYTYAVLHHPAYRSKYEINLKREFPRLPFYADFHQWVTWGKALMDLHLNYETIEPYGLRRVDVPSSPNPFSRRRRGAETPEIPGLEPPLPMGEGAGGEGKPPKAKLKADKTQGKIILDTETTLEGVPAIAWDYKLGNRSALEWILDQYKERVST